MVIGVLKFVALIKESRIENKGNALTNQPGYMTMSQLGGIAFRLAGDGLDAKLINFAV